jgi:hypothetical protein
MANPYPTSNERNSIIEKRIVWFIPNQFLIAVNFTAVIRIVVV